MFLRERGEGKTKLMLRGRKCLGFSFICRGQEKENYLKLK